MKIRYRILFFLVLVSSVALSHTSFASLNGFRQNLSTIADEIPADTGIQIVSLDRKQVLFGKNAGELLNPASTTKLVTAAAALKFLGPDYKFHTKFYLTPGGDLYIYGEGDPSIVIEEMRMIARKIVESNVRRIKNIFVDDSYFKGYTFPGLPDDKNHYNSYTGALSLNFNRINVHVKPNRRVGELAEVKADSGKVTIDVKNDVKTSSRKGRARIEFIPPTGAEELFTVAGNIRLSKKARTYRFHVPLPPLYFAQTLKALLEQNGVKVVGGIYRGEKPKEAKLILDHESKSLGSIVKDMNKFSNNFIAEQLVKVLGAKFVGVPGTTAKGIIILGKYLKSLGIFPNNYILVNGSGLTYDNRMSAEQLTRVIQDMYDSKKLWPAFEESLSVWGLDGTLRRRRKETILRYNLRAKTGSLDFVKTIAGVVSSKDGEKVAFAILLNGNVRNSRQIQTKIAKLIAQFER